MLEDQRLVVVFATDRMAALLQERRLRKLPPIEEFSVTAAFRQLDQLGVTRESIRLSICTPSDIMSPSEATMAGWAAGGTERLTADHRTKLMVLLEMAEAIDSHRLLRTDINRTLTRPPHALDKSIVWLIRMGQFTPVRRAAAWLRAEGSNLAGLQPAS